MKVKFLIINDESQLGLLEELGEMKAFFPPDPECPYWELQFEEYSIFASDRTILCVENPKDEDTERTEGKRLIKLKHI